MFTFQIGGLSSITGSVSSPYIPSSDFSPLPPLRSQISVPGSVTSSMFKSNGLTSVGNGLGSRSLASILASSSGGVGLHDTGLSHYTMASPLLDPMPGVSLPSVTPSHHFSGGLGTMGGGQGAGGGDPLLDNSNLCDILMLERALETEAAMGGGMSAAREALNQSLGGGAGDNKVDMLEIPGKGRCYVYLAR